MAKAIPVNASAEDNSVDSPVPEVTPDTPEVAELKARIAAFEKSAVEAAAKAVVKPASDELAAALEAALASGQKAQVIGKAIRVDY